MNRLLSHLLLITCGKFLLDTYYPYKQYFKYIFFSFKLNTYNEFAFADIVLELYQRKMDSWLDEIDLDLSKFNSLSAILTWKLSTTPDEITSQQAMELGAIRNEWKNKVCDSNVRTYWLKPDQKRKLYLLCRGPRFTKQLSRQANYFYICIFNFTASRKCNFTRNDLNKILLTFYIQLDISNLNKFLF